jgi:hypothetical protein
MSEQFNELLDTKSPKERRKCRLKYGYLTAFFNIVKNVVCIGYLFKNRANPRRSKENMIICIWL